MEIFDASELIKLEEAKSAPKELPVPAVTQLESFDKCRLCLKTIKNRVIISNIIQKRFSEVTQTELRHSINLPRYICTKCEKDLRSAHSYRQKLIETQQKLTQEIGEPAVEVIMTDNIEAVEIFTSELNIKQEKEDEANDFDDFYDDNFGGDDCSDQNDEDYSPTQEIYTSPLDPSISIKIEKNDKLVLKSPKKDKGKGTKKQERRSSVDFIKDQIDANSTKVTDENGRKYFLCNFCGKNITSAFSLKEHILTQHTQLEKKFHCEVEGCGFSYVTKGRLKIHMQTHKDNNKAVCPTCGKILYSMKGVREHILATHSTNKKYICDKCGFSAAIKAPLRIHMMTHIPREERMVACHLCGFVTICPKYMKRHMHEHLGIQYTCDCGKTFLYKGALQAHVRAVHDKVKPHICDTCGKAFFNKQHLVEHTLLKHTPEGAVKNIPCDVCGKLFALQSQCDKHKAVRHIRFECQFEGCGEYFNTEKRLARHMQKVHFPLRLDCQFEGCEEYFDCKKKLNRHMKKKHNYVETQL